MLHLESKTVSHTQAAQAAASHDTHATPEEGKIVMFNAQSQTQTPADTVVEGEFVDEKAGEGTQISETAKRAAHAIESLADVVGTIAPEKAGELHARAAQIRIAGAAVEHVIDDGKALYEQGKKAAGSVKTLLAKVGIEPQLIKRGRGPRSNA